MFPNAQACALLINLTYCKFMEKKSFQKFRHIFILPRDFYRHAKVCILLIPLLTTQLVTEAQNSPSKVSLNLKDVNLNTLFEELRKQTGIEFIYNTTALEKAGKINIQAKEESLEDILKKVLTPRRLDYEMKKGVVIIKPAAIPQKAQSSYHDVKGKVYDENKMPLPGVTVIIRNSLIGTSTNQDGEFTLKVPDNLANDTLCASFIGMKTEYIPLKGQQDLTITLVVDVKQVEEVIVTGIFQRRAESFTGSAVTMTREQILRTGNQNIFQSIKNLDPSLNVFESMEFGSDPNHLPDMQLRGTSSFPDIKGQYVSNPNLPLFILDGFESTLEKIYDLDMNRIESVTILKDAAAKAIYGSKAANGVMVIETIKVKPGELRISYNGNLNLEIPDLSSYKLCDAWEKLELEYKLKVYENVNPTADLEKKQLYYQNLKEVESGVNTDWLSQPLQVGVGHKHNLNFEVGDERLRVGLDLSYNKINGVMKGSDRTSFSGGVSVTYRYEKLLFRNLLTVISNKSANSPYGEFSDYAALNPYWRAYDENGNLRKFLGYDPLYSHEIYNPMYNATLNTRSTGEYFDLTNNTYAEYNFSNSMKLTARIGFNKRTDGTEIFLPGNHLDFIAYKDDNFYRKGSFEKNHGKQFAISGDLNLNYNRAFGKHIIFGNLGGNIREETMENYVYNAEGFPNDKMDNIIFARQYAMDSKPAGNESINREIGALLALNYSYDDRYLADLSARASGSSQFGANNRWGSFWSAGLGWNIHNEKFFKGSNIINQLKLRASLGYTGSQNFNSYQAMSLYNYFLDDSYMGFIGTYLEGLANKDLKWQQKFDYNYGIDLNIGNRLSIKFDYYRSKTNNLLTDITLPPSAGFDTYKANLGEILNSGYEFKLNYSVYSNPESRSYVNLFVNGAANKNKIKKISNSLQSITDQQDEESAGSNRPVIRFEEGQSLDAIWAVPSLGIDPATGKEIFVKRNGELTNEWKNEDKVVCGNTQPKLLGNFGFNTEYRGIGLNVNFNYRLGGQVYNQTLVDKVENASLSNNVDRRAYTQSWMEQGDQVLFRNIGDWEHPTLVTSRFVQDLNELNLSSISISYDFYRHKFIKAVRLERLKLIMNMNDIARISTVRIERGTSYPFARYISFTLQANF